MRAVEKPPRASASREVLLIGTCLARATIAELLCERGLSLTAFTQADAAIAECRGLSPAALLWWLDEPLRRALGDVQRAHAHFSDSPVVAICQRPHRSEVRAALAAGVAGVVLRDDIRECLLPCLEAARAGQLCVPQANRHAIAPPALSAREKQILGLVVMGYMNSEIAQRLFVTESTVKSHLSSAFAKLGVRSRNEAAALILDPQRGLGTGILALGGEPVSAVPSAVPGAAP